MKTPMRLVLHAPTTSSADASPPRRSMARSILRLLGGTIRRIGRLLGMIVLGLLGLPMLLVYLAVIAALGLLGLFALLHLAWSLILLVFWLMDGDQKLLWDSVKLFGLACAYNAPVSVAVYFWTGTAGRKHTPRDDAPFEG